MRSFKERGTEPRGGAARRSVTYANVVSTLALFLVLAGGTAYAATHYVITSTTEIKPSVLTQLKGRTGATGATGLNHYTFATSAEQPDPADQQASYTEPCPSGEHVFGGGVLDYGESTAEVVNTSAPADDAEAWVAYVDNPTGTATSFTVYAICADVTGP
jgi:hypothetical protein